jgi:hypothetical protein
VLFAGAALFFILLKFGTIILGAVSLYQVKKNTGKNAVIAIAGIILAIAAVAITLVIT